ncbi:hypothetical protein LshimejAT787_1101150 [Lyophyllum shimeji]|uniref:Uncharacterized protein n=1 Tax=Lyophyllum shimeji TaxID=47721 RepID=A0A9P3US67_LYOSH|nr:hypothetical protein LshimejAT787_1101150 [Lyophyllum shimeji]
MNVQPAQTVWTDDRVQLGTLSDGQVFMMFALGLGSGSVHQTPIFHSHRQLAGRPGGSCADASQGTQRLDKYGSSQFT